MTLIEAIPNLSEGRRERAVRTIADSFARGDGVWLLDTHLDPSHHRSVLTAVVRPAVIVEAVCRLADRALRLIDLRRHRGLHPRIGALDVLPFVPLGGFSREETVALARRAGAELARQFDLPVFLYGEAAGKDPRPLSELRRGGLAGLAERMTSGTVTPDFGPARLHETAGATAVGVRDFLIAYNVALASDDVSVARSIARTIRESSGGLPRVQALGIELAHRRLAQVSTNLLDYRVTGLTKVFDAVREDAEGRGVAIHHSEIVGLIPAEAGFEGMVARLRLERSPGILEERLESAGLAS